MSHERAVHADRSTGVGRQVVEKSTVTFPDEGLDRKVAVVGVLEETVGVAAFTDGGGAAGTYQMAGSLPAGAIVIGAKVLVPGAFAGDTSAVIAIGDGSDADRYMTGTPSVFAAAAAGVEVGVPSGAKLVTADNRPTITITSATDFGLVVTDAGGSVTVQLLYIEP